VTKEYHCLLEEEVFFTLSFLPAKVSKDDLSQMKENGSSRY
jgi:hypothetical protein